MIPFISVTIVARNAAATIQQCLASVQAFPEVVLLIDNSTTDHTADIAATFPNVSIHYTDFTGFGKIKQKACQLAKNEWILSIDADEIVSESMIDDIKKISFTDTHKVYAFHRHNHFRKRHINACGWNNDYPIRLFNRNATGFNDHDIHEAIDTKQVSTLRLNGPLLHFPYNDVTGLREKAERYALLYAGQHFRKKSSSVFKACWKSAFTFVKDYLFRKGWLYGSDGLTIAGYNALGSFLKYKYLSIQNQKLDICLIISTYNRPDALARVLESVTTQTFVPARVIIADDGSTEDTKQVVESFKSRIPGLLHVWHEDAGFRLAAIRNLALNHAGHEFVSMVDGDMVLHPDFLLSIARHAQKGWYYQGKRVLLNEAQSALVMQNKQHKIHFFSPGIANRFNTISWLSISTLISRKEKTIRGVKGCSMHFWLEDAIAVNGFNEAFVGWGREDSEFVCRLLNYGVKRKNIALGAVAWHLYHPEASRKTLPENDAILEKCIREKLRFTERGMKQLLT